MERVPIIHIVDDDESFQTGVSRLLRAAGYDVRMYANAGDFLLTRFDDTPGCILLDMRMPGPSGLELQQALAARPDRLPIIFLSGYGDVPTTVRAIKAGAADFLTKPVQRDALLNAIRNALARDAEDRIIRDQIKRWRTCYESLTAREMQVFRGVVSGKMNKEIADELGAAERTIKAHRAQVMEKMHASSVAELVHISEQLIRAGCAPPVMPRIG